MAELKSSRWVKVHKPGQANFTERENVMDIMVGADNCRAEATYTVRSYKKAAYWLIKYLEAAGALQTVADEILTKIKELAENANREEPEILANGEDWNCGIEKMCDGSFKTQLTWHTVEPITTKGEAQTAATKKRGRKKKATA